MYQKINTMKKATLLKKLQTLEQQVETELRKRIAKSKHIEQMYGVNAIKVRINNYHHLVVIDDRLVFLDSVGLQYSLYSECTLNDLIELLD